jgi:2'-hydroxyisoflavone reductase
MLGGRNFVGPHLVQTALDRGHDVTLFNRGISNPHLFPQLRWLQGDRYPDRGDGLRELEAPGSWDAVLDTWQEAPGCVDQTARMLAQRVERYLYISSIATYHTFRSAGITEESPSLDAASHVGSFITDLGYRLRKRAAELAVDDHFGERGTVLRCTNIGGRNYSGDASSHAGYWAVRFLSGEPMIVPDDRAAVVQLIDVRDMARFAIDALERNADGPYNVVGPGEPLPFREWMLAWSDVTGRRSAVVWIPPAFLVEHGVRPFDDIPNWIPASDPEPGFYRISNARARAHGLTFRPLRDTIRDSIAGLDPSALIHGTGMSPGMSRERERELIAAWRRVQASPPARPAARPGSPGRAPVA